MTTWAQDRLDALIAGAAPPPVVTKLELGTLDSWGEGWARKRWTPKPDVLNADGSQFGGYLAALADQMMAFATMSVLPADRIFRTTGFTITFHKLGRGQPLDIEARVVSQSSQIVQVSVEFRDEAGALIADARGQQVLQAMR
jgi:uncharacterized protein (TIGR00369 family)